MSDGKFTVKDAVALAAFFKFVAGNEKKPLEDVEIDNADEATVSAEGFDKAIAGCADCDPKTLKLLQGASGAFKKLANEEVYEKLADINDDSGSNDVEIMDLYLGFVKPETVAAIKDEPTTKGVAFARMKKFCPAAADMFLKASTIADNPNMKINMQSNAVELCQDLRSAAVQNGAPELSEEEKKDLETIAAYSGLGYLFFGAKLNVSSYLVGGIYGMKGLEYLNEKVKQIETAIDADPTVILEEMMPYLLD